MYQTSRTRQSGVVVLVSSFDFPPGSYFLTISEEVLAGATGYTPFISGGTIIVTWNKTSVDGTMSVTEYAVALQPNPNDGTTWIGYQTTGSVPGDGNFTLTPAAFASPALNVALPLEQNFGAIQVIRPVAQSMWAAPIVSNFINGGEIAAAYVPSGQCTSNYLSNATISSGGNVGQLQFFDALASVKGNYNGRYSEGAYVWWSPSNEQDLLFRRPDEMNAYPYPCCIVSGYVQTGIAGGPVNPIVAVRVEVVTVFEAQTGTVLFENDRCLGNPMAVSSVLQFMATQPHAMKNDEHESWISRVFRAAKGIVKSLGQFAYDHKEEIAAISARMASIAV